MDAVNQAAYSIFSGLLPAGSPRALRRLIPLSTHNPYTFDLVREGQDGDINNVQAIFIDNADNGAAIAVDFPGTQHRVVIPPQWQAILPVFGSPNLRLVLTSTGGVDVPIHLLNVPLPFAAWPTVAASVSVSTATGSFADKSGTGNGADQTLMAANANRKRFIIQNSGANSNPMYINFGAAATAAGDSIELVPGDILDSTAGPITTQAIHILATTGEKYIAKEMT